MLFMIDAKAAYRQFPRREIDQFWQGIEFEGQYFVDHATMFGMMDSGFPCCLFGDVVCWIFDNFFGATHPSLINVTITLMLKILNFIGYVMKADEVWTRWP
ncbi:hypothetical protein BC829DRAFT_397469 [Chytridium lagenaria]|nr:hypothetical protein BC829DRAFT_397469 [Chytridium lagenaria]